MTRDRLTIGQLAKRTGLRTSALRYYEEQGVLYPDGRTEAGYRFYSPEAEATLRFVRQAQRLGFSLADIRALLEGVREDTLNDQAILAIAEARLLDLERRLTELLVVHHEMASFLGELDRAVSRADARSELFFDRMIGQVCARAPGQLGADSILDWLIEQTHCTLGLVDARTTLGPLRGQHVHTWQQDDGYQILVVSEDAAVGRALKTLAQVEADCSAHTMPQVEPHREGFLFTVAGENAFIFVRLFLALEREWSRIGP